MLWIRLVDIYFVYQCNEKDRFFEGHRILTASAPVIGVLLRWERDAQGADDARRRGRPEEAPRVRERAGAAGAQEDDRRRRRRLHRSLDRFLVGRVLVLMGVALESGIAWRVGGDFGCDLSLSLSFSWLDFFLARLLLFFLLLCFLSFMQRPRRRCSGREVVFLQVTCILTWFASAKKNLSLLWTSLD